MNIINETFPRFYIALFRHESLSCQRMTVLSWFHIHSVYSFKNNLTLLWHAEVSTFNPVKLLERDCRVWKQHNSGVASWLSHNTDHHRGSGTADAVGRDTGGEWRAYERRRLTSLTQPLSLSVTACVCPPLTHRRMTNQTYSRFLHSESVSVSGLICRWHIWSTVHGHSLRFYRQWSLYHKLKLH